MIDVLQKVRDSYFFPGFTTIKTIAATQMAIPTAILAVKTSPNISVPIKIAVSGSNTPRTAVFVGLYSGKK